MAAPLPPPPAELAPPLPRRGGGRGHTAAGADDTKNVGDIDDSDNSWDSDSSWDEEGAGGADRFARPGGKPPGTPLSPHDDRSELLAKEAEQLVAADLGDDSASCSEDLLRSDHEEAQQLVAADLRDDWPSYSEDLRSDQEEAEQLVAADLDDDWPSYSEDLRSDHEDVLRTCAAPAPDDPAASLIPAVPDLCGMVFKAPPCLDSLLCEVGDMFGGSQGVAHSDGDFRGDSLGLGAAPTLPQTLDASSAAGVPAACPTTGANISSECCQKSLELQACDAVVPRAHEQSCDANPTDEFESTRSPTSPTDLHACDAVEPFAHEQSCDANPTDEFESTRSPTSPTEFLDTGSPSFAEHAPAVVQANVPAATPGESPQPPGTASELEIKEGGLSRIAPFCGEPVRHDKDLHTTGVQTLGCEAVLTEMRACLAKSSPPIYVAPDFDKLLGELGLASSLVEQDVEKPPPMTEPMSAHKGPSGTEGNVKHDKTSNRRLDLKAVALYMSMNRAALDDVTGQQIVGIFGKTGAGKSTLIQALAGKRIHRQLYTNLKAGARRCVFDAEDALEDFSIGHDKASKTRCLKSYRRGQVLYLDSPGFEDTTGKQVDIATSIAFRDVADRCSRIRFVVLINCASFLEDRGGPMRGFVQLVSTLVGGDLYYKFAFTFVFTHAERLLSEEGENLESMKDVLRGHLSETIEGTAEDEPHLCTWLRWMQTCLEKELPYAFVFHPELSDISTLAKAFEKFEPENDGNIFPAIGLKPGETPAKIVRCGLTPAAKTALKMELDSKVESVHECLQQRRFEELAKAYTDIAGLRECIPIKEVKKADGNATDAIVRHATGLRKELGRLIDDGTALEHAFGVRDAAKTFDKLVELDILARTPQWPDRNTFVDAAVGDFMHLARSIESLSARVRAALEDQVQLPNLDAAVKLLERLKIWGEAHSGFAPLALQAERCFQARLLEAVEAVVGTEDVVDLIDPTVLLLRLTSAAPRLRSMGVCIPPIDCVLAAATDRIRSSIQASRDVAQAAFAPRSGGAAEDAPASPSPEFQGSFANYATSVAHLEDMSGRLCGKPGLEAWHEECRLAQQSVLDDAREELSRRKEEVKQSLKGGIVPDVMHGQVQEMLALVVAHTEAQRHEAKMNAIFEDAIQAIVGAVDVMREELDKLCAQVATDCVRDPLPHIQMINAMRGCAWLDEHAKGILAIEIVSSYLPKVDNAYSEYFNCSEGRLSNLLQGLLGEEAISDGDVKSLGKAWAGFEGLCKLAPAYPHFVDGQQKFERFAANRVSDWLEKRRSLLGGVPSDLNTLSAWSAAPLDAALKVCDVLLPLWGTSLSSSTEAAGLKEFVDGARQRLSELADEVGGLAASKDNYTTKSTVLDAVGAWSRSGATSVTAHIARRGHDYEALCRQIKEEVAQRHESIWKSITDGIDCVWAEGELQSLEKARCLDAHIQSQASRCIDQLRQLLAMRDQKIAAALREKIDNLDFEDIDLFLQPMEASPDPLKKKQLHDIWGIIAKRIRVYVDDAKQQLGMDLVGVLQTLERANVRVGERLQKEKRVDITSLVTDLKAHANNVFQVHIDALGACLTSSDFDGIIRHHCALAKLVEGSSRPVLRPEGMAAATELLRAAGECLSPTRDKLRHFVNGPLDEEIDTTALCADLAKLQALVERSGKASASHARTSSGSSPTAQRWIVVAKEVSVQESDARDSKASRARLVQGSVVRQVSIASSDGSGLRIEYRLESGQGPETGWVTVESKGLPLLVESDDCLKLVASVGKRDSVDVHAEHNKRSKKQTPLRIGAIVRVVEKRQQRLRFEKLVGEGPSRGWVDMQIETNTLFAPVCQMPASTVAPDVDVQTMSEFYFDAVAQIASKFNDALGFLQKRNVTDSKVRALEYICRELDRGLDKHVVGLQFNAADELNQVRQRRQEYHDDYERKLLSFTEVESIILPRLDRLKSESTSRFTWFCRNEYKEAVRKATKAILDVSEQTRKLLVQGLYDRAGSSATQLRRITKVLANHLSDDKIAKSMVELAGVAKGESAALQKKLATALERGEMSRYSTEIGRYLEFVQHLATPFPDILAMSGPVHRDMHNALNSRVEELEEQLNLDMCNFSQAAKSLSILREMGRILTSTYAILLGEVEGRAQGVGEEVAKLRELCHRHFGDTALAMYGKAYALLEVPPNASETEIKHAYHRKCMQHHPDKFASRGVHREKPAEMMQRIGAAYEELCRADVREAYRNGTKALFDFRIKRVEEDVTLRMNKYLQDEHYVRAGTLLTSIRDDLPVLAEMLQPRLDVERISSTLRSIVRAHATTLRQRMGDLWDDRNLQELQCVFTRLGRIDMVFSAFEEICPSSWMENLSTAIDAKLESITSKALGYLADGERSADIHVRDVALELITLGRIFDELPKFKKRAETKINNILGACTDQFWGIPYLFKLGMLLEQGKVGERDEAGNVNATDQRIGKVIVSHFRDFQDVVIYLWNEQTCAAQKDVDTIVKDIKVCHAKADKQELDIDRAALRSGFDAYTEKYKKLFDMWHAGYLKQEDIPEQVAELVKEARVDRVEEWSRTTKDAIPDILAGIAVYFTLLKSGDRYKRLLDSGCGHRHEDIDSNAREGEHLDTDKVLQRPHDIQILTVLRLLGVDSADTGLASQLMQIRTGEGKSLILGLCSVIFGLFGFHVRCICYSNYLSQRDYDLFEAVFNAFGVHDAVTYSTIKEYSEHKISKHGDIRELSKKLLSGALRRSSPHADQLSAQRADVDEILLVDEVDVFFGSDFYGEVRRPALALREPEVSAIMVKIWEFNGQGVNSESIFETVQGWTEYAELLAKYPEWRSFLSQELQKMCRDLKYFNQPPYQYSRAENRIGYKEMDGMSYGRFCGYRTGFAYLSEAQKKTLRDEKEALDHGLCINVCCGKFSYANINPACVLGVSGTVEALDAREWGVMNKYGIRSYTLMPSVYGLSNFVFMEQNSPIVLCSTRQDFFVAITNEVKQQTQNGRGVIVFFETCEILAEYEDSKHFRTLPNKHVLTENMTVQEKSFAIKKAATGRQATFTWAVFGRGTDFFCADRKLQQDGGVHVVQAFFSESVSEEIQIQGRTARQGQKGTYRMVLETSALQSKFDIEESAAREVSPKALYKMMSEKRLQKNLHKHDEIDERLKAAEKSDTLSRNYLDALVKRDVDRASAFFRELHRLT